VIHIYGGSKRSFGYLGEKDTDFPNANAQAEQSLAVPIYPELTKEQISEVVNTITEFVKA
ncbi:MAG TPA: DegT/DnrJ/EryC1/StrS family aminotransferase, partial [bacterium]|nr:DegT/DnrJ/EryC1/StrS family aminotransferase [bacterium]